MAVLELSSPRGRLLVASMVLGSAATFFNATVVNIALPAIGEDLGAGVGLQWVATGYLLTMASLILVGGSLGDLRGRRQVYLAAGAVLVGASALCAVAPTLETLVAARLLQGVGAAGVTPIGLAIVDSSFAPSERSKAVGLWAGGSAGATAVSPFVGGLLIDAFSWRWVFVAALPLMAFSMVGLARAHPDQPAVGGRRLDRPGALLGTVAVAGSVLGITQGLADGWGQPLVIVALALAVVAAAVFVPVQRRVADPMVPMRLFSSSQFSGANAVSLVVYFAIGGAFFFTALGFQTIAGLSPAAAGAALVPANVITIVAAGRVGALSAVHGPRWLVSGGIAVMGVGLAYLSAVDGSTTYLTGILPAALVMGVGFSLFVPTLTASVLGAVADDDVGVGSGVNNAVARLGGLLAVALLPGLVGAPGDPGDPSFADAYRMALLVCAALCALGAVMAAATIGRCVATHTDVAPSLTAGCSQVSRPSAGGPAVEPATT